VKGGESLRRLRSLLVFAAIVIAFALGYKSAAWIQMAGSWFYSFQYGDSWQLVNSYIDLGISIARLIGKVILILIGLYMLIQTKHIGKWVGAGLIMTVSISLLPSNLTIPLILLAALIGYTCNKINHRKQKQKVSSESLLQEDRQNYSAILEKWENTVR